MVNKNEKITTISSSLPFYYGLSIIECGFQQKDVDFKEGPLSKTEYVLQYVVEGCGVISINNKTFGVSKGDVFLLPKNVALTYSADKNNPFSFWWLAFDGENCNSLFDMIGLDEKNPVMSINDARALKSFQKIFFYLKKNSPVSITKAMAYFYNLLSYLLSIDSKNSSTISISKKSYIKQSLAYIAKYYSTNITVGEIAKKVHLNRMYFSSLFKKEMGMSPIQYLKNYKINRAKILLTTTELSISEIATKCGFELISSFSDLFKSYTGYSPKQYRDSKHSANKKSDIN